MNRGIVVTKEIKLSPNISNHDISYRVKQANEFLRKGYTVRCTLQFRGREIVHKDIGEKAIQRFIDECSEYGSQENPIKWQGKRIYVIIRPKRRG